MVIDYHDGENGHNKIEKIYCKIFSFAIHNTKQYCKKNLTIPQYNMSIYNRVPTHAHKTKACDLLGVRICDSSNNSNIGHVTVCDKDF